MDFKQALDSKITDYNLLNHPFYEAWSVGELPVATLYAPMPASMVLLSLQCLIGWAALDDIEIAAGRDRTH